jgi:hypothetical protein
LAFLALMIRRLAPRDGVDTPLDFAPAGTLDFAQAIDPGFTVVLAAVDNFDYGPVEKLGHLVEVDAVLDEVGFPLFLVPLEGPCRTMRRDPACCVNTFVNMAGQRRRRG